MISIKKMISQEIEKKIKNINSAAEISASDIEGMLEYPPDEKMGDLALPCFKLSKSLRMAQ